MDPDPGGPKTRGSGSESPTLLYGLLMEGSGSVQIITDPDREAQKLTDPEHSISDSLRGIPIFPWPRTPLPAAGGGDEYGICRKHPAQQASHTSGTSPAENSYEQCCGSMTFWCGSGSADPSL
jgi:hypothetical protein